MAKFAIPRFAGTRFIDVAGLIPSMVRVILLSVMCLGQAVAADSASDKLLTVLSSLKDMEADFSQFVQSAQGKVLSSSKGVVRVARPERFLWQVESPDKQTIALEKGKVIIVDNDLEQVSTQPLTQEGLGPNPALLLSSDPASALVNYRVSHQKLAANIEQFMLKPKTAKGAMFEKLSLLFADNILQEMHLFDNLGQRTVISFSDIKLNKGIRKGRFKVKIPKHFDRLG